MRTTSRFRQLVVFLCLAALLISAIIPGSHGLPLAVLVAFCFFIAISLRVVLPYSDEHGPSGQAPALPSHSPRPPPEE